MLDRSATDHHLGLRLRRFRALRGMKQAHAAELLGVSQGLISRWERGQHVPTPRVGEAIRQMIGFPPEWRSDRAMRKLVECAALPVHLICDTTHRLLAASRSREVEWQAAAGGFTNTSLWRFATESIVAAEERLPDHGWFDEIDPDGVTVATEGNGSSEMRILPSILMWERVGLAEGRTGRLVTTIAFT